MGEVEPGRWNVIGRLRGRGSGPSLMLNAHMDTVGVDGMTIDPFGGEVRDGRLYGRGSQDMKGSLAAMIAAAKALVDGGIELGGDLIIAAVADEEYASIGTEDLVKHPEYRTAAAIVTEPTDMVICRAHRGFIWFNVDTFGRAAHGSRFTEGIDIFVARTEPNYFYDFLFVMFGENLPDVRSVIPSRSIVSVAASTIHFLFGIP
ncbi:MAG: M20/M25/M40 family metallo-hydrolase [Anaerolineae bacterium]